MPKLINSVNGEVNQSKTGGILVFRPMVCESATGDYIRLNGFTAYIQLLDYAETIETLIKPLGWGLKNQSLTIDLEISY